MCRRDGQEQEIELAGPQGELLRYAAVLDMLGQGVCLFDGEQRVLLSNRRYAQIYGLAPAHVLPGMTLAEIAQRRFAIGADPVTIDEEAVPPRHEPAPGAGPDRWTARLRNDKTVSVHRRPMPDGGWLEEHEDITGRVEAENEAAELRAALQAMREEHARSHEHIARLAYRDALTDLPNRAALSERLASAFEQAGASGESFAALRIDLDHFTQINEFFDRTIGDALLREVGKRLDRVAEGAFVARSGGDEFILLVPGAQPAAAASLAGRIEAEVAGDLEIEGQRLRLGLSMGIAVYPADGADEATLLDSANSALRRAKTEGRGCYRFFEAGMDKRQRERSTLQRELSSVLEGGELALHYQPQAEIDGSVFGFEALVRWRHPTRGLIMPGEFIALAEESGLISEIGEWVLREACREAASWAAPLQIAVNVSPVQFRFPDLAELVRSVLAETGLDPRRLELEITESVLIDSPAAVLLVLRRLHAMGVKIAMDDFGKGYSSLSSLQTFPFDKIKIDREFIANLGVNENSAAIVRAVIGLGSSLNVPVIAEGVETEEQLAILAEEGCREVQGYLIGYPRSIDHYADLVAERPPRVTILDERLVAA